MQSRQRVTELFDQALEHAPDSRSEFLKSACAGDTVLLREVESLLAEYDADTGFLESPAVAAVADQIGEDTEDLLIGRHLGNYRVDALLGSGGMGDVYLGSRSDGQFEQEVAIKLLKHGFSGDDATVPAGATDSRPPATLGNCPPD